MDILFWNFGQLPGRCYFFGCFDSRHCILGTCLDSILLSISLRRPFSWLTAELEGWPSEAFSPDLAYIIGYFVIQGQTR